MTFYDFIIIYLACGAPFGAFYFVNHRRWESRVLIRTFLITLFWLPFAFHLIKKFIDKKPDPAVLSKQEILRDEEITVVKKNLERIFSKYDPRCSVFELREVFDRYTGLTLAKDEQEISTTENSLIYKIAGNNNFELAAKCQQRRNRKLLSFHQTLAEQDFLTLVSEFVSRFPAVDEIEIFSFKLVRLLDDEKTEKLLKTVFKNRLQSADNLRVLKTEKEKWITDLQKQSPVNN